MLLNSNGMTKIRQTYGKNMVLNHF